MAKVRIRTKRNYDHKKDTSFHVTDGISMTDSSGYMSLRSLLARYATNREVNVLEPQFFIKDNEIDILSEIERYITPDDVKKMDKLELEQYKRKVKRHIIKLQQNLDSQIESENQPEPEPEPEPVTPETPE